jgi:endo-1,4-beta-xylanase
LTVVHSVRRPLGVLAALAVVACGSDSGQGTTSVPPGVPVTQAPGDSVALRTYAAKRNMFIGAAIDRGFRYSGSDGVTFKTTMTRQFNILTPENDMKFDRLHPARNTYRFEPSDSLIAFAEANGMRVRGHNLVWHSQLASWLTSGTWTKDEAKALLVDHITQVVTHFRGHIMEWDVLNEGLADNGALRSGFWLDHIGPEYVELAFRTARAADPTVGLFYNDYNIEGINAKSDSALAFVKDLLAKGVPITGVGFESHFQLNGVPSTLAANIARFSALGLEVHITELDVRLQTPGTAALFQTQAQNYGDVVSACTQSPACDVIVMWGFTDKESWVPSAFPGWGDALIFDTAYQPKPAFTTIQGLLKN